MEIRALTDEDREWARALLIDRWITPRIVTRGRAHEADKLPGFIAVDDGEPKGLLTYRVQDGDCEVVTLDAVTFGQGIGSALMRSLLEKARPNRWRRIWLITTNDNTRALRFYQKLGFELVAIHRNAIGESRRLKPEIPEKGCDGIPIRDEMELEFNL
jgi:ribosomal protein S18 acetylase RimI-like enzyme